MGRCGCEGTTCGCKVVGDGGINVTGSGTAANPYRVSGSMGLQAIDTESINMLLLGTGSQSDPWRISAEFAGKLDDLLDVDTSGGVDGYVLARQADGTYALVPPATTAPGLIATGTSLEGDGSGGDPLVVKLASNSGLELSAGGLRLDPYTVTTEADLDVLYGALPAGSVVADDDGSGLWVKTTSGWVSLIEDSGTITTVGGNFTAGSNWSINSFKIRRRNGIVQLAVHATRTASIPSSTSGNVAALTVVGTIVDPIMRPVFSAAAGGSSEHGPTIGAWVNNSGQVILGSINPGIAINSGEDFTFYATYLGA